MTLDILKPCAGVAGCVLVCKRRQPSKTVSAFAAKASAFADTPNDSPRSAQPMRRRKSRKSGTHFELPQDSPGGKTNAVYRLYRYRSILAPPTWRDFPSLRSFFGILYLDVVSSIGCKV